MLEWFVLGQFGELSLKSIRLKMVFSVLPFGVKTFELHSGRDVLQRVIRSEWRSGCVVC